MTITQIGLDIIVVAFLSISVIILCKTVGLIIIGNHHTHMLKTLRHYELTTRLIATASVLGAIAGTIRAQLPQYTRIIWIICAICTILLGTITSYFDMYLPKSEDSSDEKK